jgi:hypothetical protein
MNNSIKKYFPLGLILILLSINLFADRLPLEANDAVQVGHVTKLLWQSTKLTETEGDKLFKIVKYQHDDVASYAFVTAIVRKPDNFLEILKYASSLKVGNVHKIANEIMILQKTNNNILSQFQKKMKNKKLSYYSASTPDDYYRDALVYNAIRKAREKQEPVIIPAKIMFNWKQKGLLKYAGKPSVQAFDYIFSIIKKQKKKSNTSHKLIFALSAYEKVFVSEAVDKLRDVKVTNLEKEAMKVYLNKNRYRLTLKEYNLIQKIFHKITKRSVN